MIPAQTRETELQYALLMQAADLAAKAHRGQIDKAGEPYLWHVLRVGCSLLPDLHAAIAGILHDVFEDCPDDAIRAQVESFDPRIVTALRYLTRDPDWAYELYIDQVLCDPLAVKVKLADLADNLNPGRLARAAARGVNTQRLSVRYTLARAYLLAHSPGGPQ